MRRMGLSSNADRLLPFLLAGLAVLEILLIHDGYDHRLFVPLALLLPLTLIRRRQWPLAVLATNIAAWVVIDLNSPINEDPLALAITSRSPLIRSELTHKDGR